MKYFFLLGLISIASAGNSHAENKNDPTGCIIKSKAIKRIELHGKVAMVASGICVYPDEGPVPVTLACKPDENGELSDPLACAKDLTFDNDPDADAIFDEYARQLQDDKENSPEWKQEQADKTE